MSATTWLIVAIVGFSVSGIALVATVFIFFKMNIISVIGDLTGKTVAKEIKAMRDANTFGGNKIHRSSSVNVHCEKTIEKVGDDETDSSVIAVAHASKRLDGARDGYSAHLKRNETGQTSCALYKGITTESLSTNVGEVDIEQRRATAVLSRNRGTEVLGEDSKTDVLYPTEVPANNMVSEGRAETTVLSDTEELSHRIVEPVAFRITKSVIKIHTDEVI